MRILHLYKDYFPPTRGGIEHTLARMATEQARDGHDVTVLTASWSSAPSRTDMVEGVRVIRTREWGRIASAPLCPTMPAHLARLRADIAHLHFPSPTGEISWLLAHPPMPMVVTYHSDIVRQKAVLPLYAPVIRAVLRDAHVIMPTSDAYIEFSDFLRPHRAKCEVVPLGVDIENYENLRRDYAPAAAAIRASLPGPLTLFIGKLRYYKGVDVLLRAWRDVPGTLVIVGEGPEEAKLRALHTQLGLGDRVQFAGEVDGERLRAYLAAGDIGVLPSVLPSEAFGVAMVEMMASGMPVVCTELGTGTTFVNQRDVTGLVVPPRDPAALGAALTRLAHDAALRERMGAAAQMRARNVLSRQAMMRGVATAYARAMDAAGPAR